MNSQNNKTEGVKKITRDGKLLAIVFPRAEVEGVNFLTPPELPLQVGILNHYSGKIVEMHKHLGVENKTDFANEWIYMEKGEARIIVADENWNEVETIVLKAGESIMLISGAHKVEFGKGAKALEVKQGPYPGLDNAKIYKNENTGQ